MAAVGENIDIKVTGNKAVITIDISKRLGPSASGKTEIVAKSGSPTPKIPGTEVSLNLTAYTK